MDRTSPTSLALAVSKLRLVLPKPKALFSRVETTNG